jgi:hypothetical protein
MLVGGRADDAEKWREAFDTVFQREDPATI